MKRIVILLLAWLFVAAAASCGSEVSNGRREKAYMPHADIGEVLRRHTDRLMAIPGVVGVAIGEHENRPVILVLLARKTDAVMRQIPSELEGFPVVVEETGAIRRLDKPG